MTTKLPTSEQVQTALGDGLKGAAAGMALGPVGAIVGGVGGTLAALISDLVPGLVLPSSTKPAVADAAAFITASPTEEGQVKTLEQDPNAARRFKAQVVQIAQEEQQKSNDRDERIQQMLLELIKTDQADTANARQMGVQLAQAGSKVQWAQPVVSVCVTLGFFAVLTIMLFMRSDVSPMVLTVVQVLVGVLATKFSQTVDFWLGSSHGSMLKNELLANSVPASLLPAPAALVPAADVPPH